MKIPEKYKELLKYLRPHIPLIFALGLFFWQTMLLRENKEDRTIEIAFFVFLIILLIVTALRFLFRRIHGWKDIEIIILLIISVNIIAKAYVDLSSPWLYLHYFVVSLVSATYNFAFSLAAVALIDLSLYLQIVSSGRYGEYITKSELLGMAFSLPALAILINLLQAIEKRKRAKVTSELAFLRYAIDGLDAVPSISEESRVQRDVNIVQEVTGTMQKILKMLRLTFKAHSCVFIQIVTDADKSIIRAYDTASKEFITEHHVSLQSSVYQFAMSKQSPFQKQSDNPLNKTAGYYVTEKEPVKSILVVPLIESAFVIGLIAIDRFEKEHFTQEEVDLVQKYSEFIMYQLRLFKMLKESEEKAAQFQMLSHISRELLQSMKMKEILDRLLDYCQQAAPYDACLLIYRDNNNLELMIQRGFDEMPLKLKMGQSKNWAEWFLLNSDNPLLLNDVRTVKMPLWHANERIKKWKAIYAIPMMRKASIIGLLLFAAEKDDLFKSHIRTMLSIIANQASVIIENSMLYEQTEFQATTDGLTEVPNHRYFQETLMNYMQAATENKESISLVIADLDYFKNINDTYGHQFGDKVLKKVAQLLKNNIRNNDFIARYGGEEFAIILSECEEEDAYKVVEKIRKKIQKHTWDVQKQKVSVTISMGIASFPKQAKTKDDLIKMADTALYKAKNSGRNMVTIFRAGSEE